MTFTLSVHVPLVPVPLLARAGMVAPVMVTMLLPGVAVMAAPAQVLDATAGLATTSCKPVDPTGRLSVKLTAVIGCADILV